MDSITTADVDVSGGIDLETIGDAAGKKRTIETNEGESNLRSNEGLVYR